LSDSILTLAPQRADMGEYSLTLVATAGGESQSSTLQVSVLRFNSPPTGGLGHFSSDIRAYYDWTCPNPKTCTAIGTPVLHLYSCDAEGDGVTFELEVIQRGQPFSRKPTYAAHVPAGAASRYTDGKCADVAFALSELVREQSYDFAIRISDEFGAISTIKEGYFNGGTVNASDGWATNPMWGFDQGPCTTRQCACHASGAYSCLADADCCSGVCRLGVNGFATCQPCAPEQHCACMASGHGPCLVDTDCCSGSCQQGSFPWSGLACK